MAKKRIPGTIEDAITMIMAELGREQCGDLIGRSASLVYKMADPDNETTPNILQAVALDMAMIKQNGEAPIFTWYERVLQQLCRSIDAGEEPKRCIKRSVMEMTNAVGEVAGAVTRFTDKDSEDGESLSHNERAILAEQHRKLLHTVNQIEEIINPTPTLAKG